MPQLNTRVKFCVLEQGLAKTISEYQIDNENSEHRRNMGRDCGYFMQKYPDDFQIISEAIPMKDRVGY